MNGTKPNANLLEETIAHIESIGKTIDDVDFIAEGFGYSNREPTVGDWSEFAAQAILIDYDAGYGTAKIHPSLVIVYTDNTWSSRGEYDGSEWWEWNKLPERPSEGGPLAVPIMNSAFAWETVT